MFESHVPAYFWPEAIATSNYLTNRLLTKKLDFKTPLKTLNSFTAIPPSHNLPPWVFGCVVDVHLKKGDRINCNLELPSVCLLDMVFFKRVIDVFIQFITRCIL